MFPPPGPFSAVEATGSEILRPRFWRNVRKTMGFHQEIPGSTGRDCYGKWLFIVDFPIKNGDFP